VIAIGEHAEHGVAAVLASAEPVHLAMHDEEELISGLARFDDDLTRGDLALPEALCQREVMPCICGGVLVVVARFRAAAVLRLSWRSSSAPADPGSTDTDSMDISYFVLLAGHVNARLLPHCRFRWRSGGEPSGHRMHRNSRKQPML
jgi:hypothetical protein